MKIQIKKYHLLIKKATYNLYNPQQPVTTSATTF